MLSMESAILFGMADSEVEAAPSTLRGSRLEGRLSSVREEDLDRGFLRCRARPAVLPLPPGPSASASSPPTPEDARLASADVDSRITPGWLRPCEDRARRGSEGPLHRTRREAQIRSFWVSRNGSRSGRGQTLTRWRHREGFWVRPRVWWDSGTRRRERVVTEVLATAVGPVRLLTSTAREGTAEVRRTLHRHNTCECCSKTDASSAIDRLFACIRSGGQAPQLKV